VAARLSPDGQYVFFVDTYSPTGDATTYPPGLYYTLAAGGDTPHLIASEDQISAVLGSAASVYAHPGNILTTLGVSADGDKLVFLARLPTPGNVLMGVNRNGSGLHAIGPVGSPLGFDYLAEAGISADGSTAFRYDYINGPGTLTPTVYNFDGTNGRTLAVPN